MGVVPDAALRAANRGFAGRGEPAERSQPGYSPLQMALAAAAISAGGVRPAPQLVIATHNPQTGWMPVSALGADRTGAVTRGGGEHRRTACRARTRSSGRRPSWQRRNRVNRSPGLWAGHCPAQRDTVCSGAGDRGQRFELATQIGQAMLEALKWGEVAESPVTEKEGR